MFYGHICDTAAGYSASSQAGHITNSGIYMLGSIGTESKYH